MPRARTIAVELPTDTGMHDGLAYSLWLPRSPAPSLGGVVVLHGAGSCKENHHDFARAASGARLGAIAFDQRGHGDSEGPMDGGAVDDIVTMAMLLRSRLAGLAGLGARDRLSDAGAGNPTSRAGNLPSGAGNLHSGAGNPTSGAGNPPSRAGKPNPPIALRGSSMGGYLALVSAARVGAAAVVAICPASGEGLRDGLAAGRFTFAADTPVLDALLAAHEVKAAAQQLDIPVLLLHAEGDEQVPVEHSRELAALLRSPRSRLITPPGGHHRSIQHDAEMQAVSLRFIERALAEPGDENRG